MSNNNIAIIIVNWNGREHLETCLSSIFNQTYNNFIVIFIDNGSTDDSVSFVKARYPQVKIICIRKNVGFAEGNNIGIRLALRDPKIKYIATLNNDTKVDKDWLRQLLFEIEKDKRIGAVASKMLFFYQHQIIDSAGDYLLPYNMKVVTRGHKKIDQGQYDRVEECFSARAGAALYCREMLEDVCLGNDYFDRHYFAYLEDSDLSIRARLFGWKIVYNFRAIAYHKVAATGKKINNLLRLYYSGRNKLFTMIKNYPVKLWLPSLRISPPSDLNYKISFLEKFKIYSKALAVLFIAIPRLLHQRKIIKAKRRICDSEINRWFKDLSLNQIRK